MAITRSVVDRKTLLFRERTDAALIEHAGIDDLSMFYKGMVWLDESDGSLDGNIASTELYLEIPFITDPMLHAIEQYRSGVFSIKVENRSGSSWEGTAWIADREVLPDGFYKYYLISNAHVMDDGTSEELRWVAWNSNHEHKYVLTVLGVDQTTDVSISTLVTRDELPVLKMAGSVPTAGSPIAILGNQMKRGVVYTSGSINNPANYAGVNPFPVIHHDVNSSGGNSGSPVFDKDGFVIGMHFQGDKSGSANIGFAIPIYILLESYRSIRGEGQCRHGNTSQFSYTYLTQDQLRWIGVNPDTGYYVNYTIKGSEADRAGLKVGDILLSVDGKPVPAKEWQAAEYQLFKKRPGDPVELTVASVQRPGQIRKLQYKNAGQINPILETWETPLGFTVTGLTETERQEVAACSATASQGVVIRFDKKTDASDPFSGLRNGMVITSLNGRAVNGVGGFRNIFDGESGNPMVVDVTGTLFVDTLGAEIASLHRCQEARLLLNGLSGNREEGFTKAGMYGIKLSRKEQEAFGITPPVGEAYYVTSVSRSPSGPTQDPLFRGDVLVAMNGYPLDSIKIEEGEFGSRRVDLEGYLSAIEKTVLTEWTVWRNGSLVKVKREIVPSKVDEEKIESDPFFFTGHTVTASLAERLGLDKAARGVYIELSPNQRGQTHPYGFGSGMVITTVNGVEVKSDKDLRREIKKAKDNERALVFEVLGNYHWDKPSIRRIVFSEVYLKE